MGFRFPGSDEGDFGPPPPPFRIRRRGIDLTPLRSFNRWAILGVLVILLYITLNTGKGIFVDWLWFDGAGYQDVYTKMLYTRLLLFIGGALLFAVYFGVNLFIASRPLMQTPARGLAEPEAASLRRLYLLGLIAGTLFFAVIFGSIAASHWDVVLRFTNSESFGVNDPQFGKDVGFFVFRLPGMHFAYGWLMGAAVLTTLGAASLYLFSFLVAGNTSSSVRAKRHLIPLLLVVIALFIWRYWLQRFELNYSTSGVVFGATYTDVHARLQFIYIGMGLGVITAIVLVASLFRGGVGSAMAAMAVWAAVSTLGGQVYPATVQRVNVQPNELEKERPYIERNIEMTRRAFGLDKIDERAFPAALEVTPQEITDNPDTIRNIRLLDVRPLKDTYAQIQTIRPLYEFLDVDVDRYTIDGTRTQVMLAARELSPGRLPIDAQSWVNRRLQFTHGYGAVMSPVNEVVQEGLPDLLLRDIPVTGKVPVNRPEIYYGEEPEHYVVVKTKAKEFDYPTASGNAQNVFEGEGGVKLGGMIRRLLFAWQFGDLNIAISDSADSNSRLLFHRNIGERVKTLAPFLTLDHDPYLVIADGRLYWIQDAYTTTHRYPYSTPSRAGYNYIRNSVKVVIDAYDGTTTFYTADPSDPILKTYARIFPKLFTPLDSMPAALRSHLRYPEDLFLAQINQYRLYHIKDAGGVYNKEDIWNIPNELVYGGEAMVQPYYVIMRIPGETTEEFVLFLPMTPAKRDNTIAWVAARADGANYGKMLSFRFPTDSLVYGPRQVDSRIDQDTLISQQFSLWNQSGSRVIRGNLLMIPIGRGNLFVEPIYLQAETSQLPELKRVVVVNGNRIAMEPSLQRSLEVIFGAAAPTLPTADTSGGPGVTTPSATPTPVRTPAPAPTAGPAPTPAPVGTPGSIADLAREADAAFQRAQDALRRGDFATYGQEIARAQELVQRIAQQSGAR